MQITEPSFVVGVLVILFAVGVLVGFVMMVGGFAAGTITYILNPREKSKPNWFGISIKGFIIIVVAVVLWFAFMGLAYMTGYLVPLIPVGSDSEPRLF